MGSKQDKPLFADVDCEYSLLVRLAAAKDIEQLDAELEHLLNTAFDTTLVDILSPASVPEGFSANGRRYSISTGLDESIREVVIHENRTSPMRRFMDAALSIYTHHYELLLKSQVDKLTGLYNRQMLEEKVKSLNGSVGHAERRQSEIERIIVLFDIDHFKSINDNYGHSHGDEVLVMIAHMMKQTFRLDDWLFRYGGEEFLVILNNISIEEARQVIGRFLKSVSDHEFLKIGKVTLSAGYARYHTNRAFSTSLDEADKALYFAKENGRNQFHDYAQLVSSDSIEAIDRGSDIDLF